MRKSSSSPPRDWTQICSIYGVEDPHTPLFLLINAIAFSTLSVTFLHCFEPICHFLARFFSPGTARFLAGFTGSVTALTALCLFFAAGHFFYSAVSLRWEMSQRMVSMVSDDWSAVGSSVLDLGCGRGMLLNAVALQLKKSGSSGRVVGLGPTRTLRTAGLEGVQEYVTCRSGDPRTLPFSNGYFDVVVSALFLHTVGKEHGPKSAAAAAERTLVLGEVVRVLRPGGVAVVWDLLHAPEYAQRLKDLGMEDVTVSERVTAFMVGSHIVSFRKPRQQSVRSCEEDWIQFNVNLC